MIYVKHIYRKGAKDAKKMRYCKQQSPLPPGEGARLVQNNGFLCDLCGE